MSADNSARSVSRANPVILQPNGRKGLLPSRELSDPNDLAGAHGEDPGFPPLLEV
jgi:hypothetical protein